MLLPLLFFISIIYLIYCSFIIVGFATSFLPTGLIGETTRIGLVVTIALIAGLGLVIFSNFWYSLVLSFEFAAITAFCHWWLSQYKSKGRNAHTIGQKARLLFSLMAYFCIYLGLAYCLVRVILFLASFGFLFD